MKKQKKRGKRKKIEIFDREPWEKRKERIIGGKRMKRRMIRGKNGSSGAAKTRGEQREKLERKSIGEEREGEKKKRKGVKRVVVVGGSMIGRVEEYLLGKGLEVEVVSLLGDKMWDVRRYLGKWTKEKMDCVVVHVGTSHIQRGMGFSEVGEFGKEAGKLIDEVDNIGRE